MNNSLIGFSHQRSEPSGNPATEVGVTPCNAKLYPCFLPHLRETRTGRGRRKPARTEAELLDQTNKTPCCFRALQRNACDRARKHTLLRKLQELSPFFPQEPTFRLFVQRNQRSCRLDQFCGCGCFHFIKKI